MMSGQREKNRHGYLFKLNTDKTCGCGFVLSLRCITPHISISPWLPAMEFCSLYRTSFFGDFSAILTCHSLKSGCPVFQRHQISVS